MSTPSRRAFIAAITLAGLAAGATVAQPAQPTEPVKSALTPGGRSAGLVLAPGIDTRALLAARLIDLEGRPSRFVPRAGRVTVVNFWARWCGPCKAEIPELVALHARGAVDVVGIAIESEPAPVRDFARAYEMTYALHLAREGGTDLLRALGNERAGLPFTLVLDGGGRVAAMRLGQLTPAQLEAALAQARAGS